MSVPGFVFFFIFGIYLLCKILSWLLKEKPRNIIIIQDKNATKKDKKLVDDMVLLDMQGEDEYTFDLVE